MDILNALHRINIRFTLDNALIGIVIVLLILLLIFIIYKLIRKLFNKVCIARMNINIANIGSIEIEKNKDVSCIAYKVWVEIMTRKVGLHFEEGKDVVAEVYDSWYDLFGIVRELLKQIKPNKYDKGMKKLENLLIKVLNEGLRPHLTEWQAKFRKWYDSEVNNEKNEKLSPQEIQERYPQYKELIKDLKDTNEKIVQFAEELEKLWR